MPPSYEPYNVNNAPPEPNFSATPTPDPVWLMPTRPPRFHFPLWLSIIIACLLIASGAGAYLVTFQEALVSEWLGLTPPILPSESAPTSAVTTRPTANVIDEVIDETADWQTYRNEEYGFEFKYPANYEIDESSHTDTTGRLSVSVFDPEYGNPENVLESTSLSISINTRCSAIDEWQKGVHNESWAKRICLPVDGIQVHLTATNDSLKTIPDQIFSTFHFTTPVSTPATS